MGTSSGLIGKAGADRRGTGKGLTGEAGQERLPRWHRASSSSKRQQQSSPAAAKPSSSSMAGQSATVHEVCMSGQRATVRT